MKRIIGMLLVFITLIISSCGNTANKLGKEVNNKKDDDKVQIVFEYQDGHVRDDFKECLEAKFDVEVILRPNYSTSAYYRLEQELTHDMAPDIVVCQDISRLDTSILAEYFYDMSADGYVKNFYLSAIKACTASDGGLYYLPGPSYIYGVVYDKTAFKELGLDTPTNYSEFVELINTVDSMGLIGEEPDPEDNSKTVEVPVKGFVPTLKWPDMFQIIFNTMGYEKSLRGVKNTIWLNEYQKGQESMVGQMESAAYAYLRLFEDGVLTEDLFNIKAPYRSQKLYKYHTSLMTIECQNGYEYNIKQNEGNTEDAHEMGMMPIYTSDEPDSDYLYAIPRSFFGVTKHGMEDRDKREMLLDILDYLCTPEGQKVLVNSSDYFGFLKEDASIENDFYEDVIETIEEGRIISNFYYEGDGHGNVVESYLHGSTSDLVNGNITVSEWLLGADTARDNALTPQEQTVIAKAAETLEPVQLAYVIGEAYLNAMDADIGYVPVDADYGMTAYLYSGDITELTIEDITTMHCYMPKTVEGDMDFVVVEITGQELYNHAVNWVNNDGMFTFAGADMVVSRKKTEGTPIVSIKIDGEEMNMSKTYRVAALRGSVFTSRGDSVADAKVIKEYPDLTFNDVFCNYVTEVLGSTVSPPEELTFVE